MISQVVYALFFDAINRAWEADEERFSRAELESLLLLAEWCST